MKVMTALLGLFMFAALSFPHQVEGGVLFNAAKKSFARKIFRYGFNPRKMAPKARYGPGVYLSKTKVTALKEKPASNAINTFKYSQSLEKKAIDTTRMSNTALKKVSGDNDLRGNIHKRIIGPKLGHRIGKEASLEKRAVIYRSAKDPRHRNIFIPKSHYVSNPKIIKPQGLIANGR